MMHPTLILDLDGTLVDSVPDINAALNRLLAACAAVPLTRPETAAMVGDGAHALVERVCTLRNIPFTETLLATFVADYTAHSADATHPFPDAEATLALMQASGWRFAICTNKPYAATMALLDALDLSRWFAAIGGGDSFATRKPHPAHLLETLKAAGGTPTAAIMVGDHRNDINAAAAAHIPSIFAAWGYGTPQMQQGATAIASRFADLPGIAAGLI